MPMSRILVASWYVKTRNCRSLKYHAHLELNLNFIMYNFVTYLNLHYNRLPYYVTDAYR